MHRGHLVPLDSRLLEEAWPRKEVNWSHLKVFGYISYVHIDAKSKNQLDAKNLWNVFSFDTVLVIFGCQFWDEKNRKIIRNINVVFNAKVMHKDKENVYANKKDYVELKKFMKMMFKM